MTDTLRSVGHALRVLVHLKNVDDAGVSEVASAVGVGGSTSYRLLATLVEGGFVVQDAGTRRYRLGPEMIMPGRSDVLEHRMAAAAPHLVALRDAVGETVHLARLDGEITDFVAVEESRAVMRVTSRVGTAQPAHVTSAGKVLLARCSDEELLALYPVDELAGGLTDRSISRRSDLFAEIASIRKRGYAKNSGESEPGVAALAMAIGGSGSNSSATMSIAISGPESRMQLGKTTPSRAEREMAATLADYVARIESDIRF